MRTQPASPPPPSLSRTTPRRPLLLALVLAVLLAGALGTFAVTRGSNTPPPPPGPPTTSPPPALATTTTLDERTEVVARLKEILKIRDEAYRTRDPNLLQSIFTKDCPCLKGDREVIGELIKREIIWTKSVSEIQVQKVERASSQLWVVTAILTVSPFEIRKGSGELVRTVPRESDLSRYALTRLDSSHELKLGRVSFIRRIQ